MTAEESLLFELVDQWESARRAGRSADPKELCAEHPSLLPELVRRIQAIEATAWLEKPVTPTRLADTQDCLHQLGRYKLLERIGQGGSAEVWKARDPELERFVAIKIPRTLVRGFQPEHFLEEARKVAQLHHPGIVSVFDVGRDEEWWYIVSELVSGGSLAERLKRSRFTFEETAHLVRQVAEALHHAHQHGFIHRDIKPQNILLDEHGHPKLTDFGIALSESQSVAKRSRTAGTVAYMSPEQGQNLTEKIDSRTDIYSLGVVLYQMLTVRLPFMSDDLMELWGAVISQAPRTPRTLDGSIPIPLEAICLKAMAKNPEERYSVALDMAQELNAFLQTRSRQSPPYLRNTLSGLAISVVVAGAFGGYRLAPWASSEPQSGPVNQRPLESQRAAETPAVEAETPVPPVETALPARPALPAEHPKKEVKPAPETSKVPSPAAPERISNPPKEPEQKRRTKPATDSKVAAEAALQRGISELQRGAFAQAVSFFDQALERDRHLSAAWHGRGVARYNQGRFLAAVPDLRRAIELDPDPAEYYKNLAFALAKAKVFDDAIETVLLGEKRTRAGDAKNYHRFVAQIYDARAVDRSQRKDYDGALSDLDEAIRWDASHADAFHDRGAVHFNRKDFHRAIEDFDRAIELAPDRPEFYLHRGHARRAVGREKDGQADYAKASSLSSK